MTEKDLFIRNEKDAELVRYGKKLAKAIQATAAKYDESGEFPFEHFEILEEEGYFKLTVPKEYGGDELSLYEILLVQEELAKAYGSTALAVGWHLMTFFSARNFRPWKEEVFQKLCEDAVERGKLLNVLATESGAGNIVRGGKPTTIAKKTDGGFIINGRKSFATLAPILEQFNVLAYVEEEDRVAEFLIKKNESVRVIPTWNVLGMRSTGSDDIELNDVFVPTDALLSYVDQENRISGNSSAYSLQIPTIYLGIATAARDFIIDYAENKFSPSLGDVISKAAHVQQKIGEIEIHLNVARRLIYPLAEKWDDDLELRTKLSNEVAITKHAVCNHALEIVKLAMNIAGGNALSKDLPLERYFRDVQCGLYNPPHPDMVIQKIATSALEEYRNKQAYAY